MRQVIDRARSIIDGIDHPEMIIPGGSEIIRLHRKRGMV
jgi:hypothetical protein